jgi:hypothetical protein
MPHIVTHRRIEKTPAEVFDFVGPNIPENNPRYEREVIAWTNVTPRPIRTGTTAVMHRLEGSKRRDVRLLCVDYQQDRRIAWDHTDPGPFKFAIAFETLPADKGATDLVVTVDITLSGPLRLMAPLFARRSRAVGAELTERIRSILETGSGALSPLPEAALLAR